MSQHGTLRSHRIQSRSGELPNAGPLILPKATHITPTHIVRHDVDDVRAFDPAGRAGWVGIQIQFQPVGKAVPSLSATLELVPVSLAEKNPGIGFHFIAQPIVVRITWCGF
jgi:hypothetical protein